MAKYHNRFKYYYSQFSISNFNVTSMNLDLDDEEMLTFSDSFHANNKVTEDLKWIKSLSFGLKFQTLLNHVRILRNVFSFFPNLKKIKLQYNFTFSAGVLQFIRDNKIDIKVDMISYFSDKMIMIDINKFDIYDNNLLPSQSRTEESLQFMAMKNNNLNGYDYYSFNSAILNLRCFELKFDTIFVFL